jgi:hypothetical protein
VEHLQRLLPHARPQEGYRSLERFVTFYCVRKIRSRLNMKYIARTKMLDTVLNITTADITDAFCPEVAEENIPKANEVWMQALSQCSSLRLGSPDEDGRRTLERTVQNERILWRYLVLILRVLRRASDSLSNDREHLKPEKADDIESRLDKLCGTLRSLDDLLSRSPSFWCLLRNPALMGAFPVSRRFNRPDEYLTCCVGRSRISRPRC